MNQLQIVIDKSGYAIHHNSQHRRLVSNIKRMDDALEIYRELTGSSNFPPGKTPGRARTGW